MARRSAISSAACARQKCDQRHHVVTRLRRRDRAAAARTDGRSTRTARACRRATSVPSSSTPMRSPSAKRLAQIVRDEQDGLAQRRLDAAELAVQVEARQRIERAERFVHQEDRRIEHQRARDADALPLSAGEFDRASDRRSRRRQADQREQRPRRRAAMRACGQRSTRASSVMFSATVRCGKSADVLEHVAGAPPQRDRIPLARVAAFDAHAPAVGQRRGG